LNCLGNYINFHEIQLLNYSTFQSRIEISLGQNLCNYVELHIW